MRKAVASLLLLMLVAAGCSRPRTVEQPAPVVEPPTPAVETPPTPDGPDLMAVQSPFELTIDELRRGLVRYLSQGEGELADRLSALYDRWQLATPENYVRLVEADLDGNGTAEVVTALNGSGSLTGVGQVFVITRANGAVAVEPVSGEPLEGVGLFAVTDLTGDAQREMIWTSTHVGAHTPTTELFLSRWRPGQSEVLPGAISMASARVELEGNELVLTGGMIGSVGAGPQRSRTERYRWTGERIELVDQRYASSTLGYFRLIDGIVAERFAHVDEAARAYRDAMADAEPNLEGVVEPDMRAGFVAAVRAFARFRLGALLLAQGQGEEARRVLVGEAALFAELPALMAEAGEREAGCKAAEAWANTNASFLEALNSTFGYAQPRWQAVDLCGPLPATGL